VHANLLSAVVKSCERRSTVEGGPVPDPMPRAVLEDAVRVLSKQGAEAARRERARQQSAREAHADLLVAIRDQDWERAQQALDSLQGAAYEPPDGEPRAEGDPEGDLQCAAKHGATLVVTYRESGALRNHHDCEACLRAFRYLESLGLRVQLTMLTREPVGSLPHPGHGVRA